MFAWVEDTLCFAPQLLPSIRKQQVIWHTEYGRKIAEICVWRIIRNKTWEGDDGNFFRFMTSLATVLKCLVSFSPIHFKMQCCLCVRFTSSPKIESALSSKWVALRVLYERVQNESGSTLKLSNIQIKGALKMIKFHFVKFTFLIEKCVCVFLVGKRWMYVHMWICWCVSRGSVCVCVHVNTCVCAVLRASGCLTFVHLRLSLAVRNRPPFPAWQCPCVCAHATTPRGPANQWATPTCHILSKSVCLSQLRRWQPEWFFWSFVFNFHLGFCHSAALDACHCGLWSGCLSRLACVDLLLADWGSSRTQAGSHWVMGQRFNSDETFQLMFQEDTRVWERESEQRERTKQGEK